MAAHTLGNRTVFFQIQEVHDDRAELVSDLSLVRRY